MQGPDRANDLSLYPEAYQKQADIITAKILHQLCSPRVTESGSGENQRESERGRRKGARELISGFNLRSKGCELASLTIVVLRSFLPWPGGGSAVSSQLVRNHSHLHPRGDLGMCKLFNLISKITKLMGEVVGDGLVFCTIAGWFYDSNHKSPRGKRATGVCVTSENLR